MSEPASSKEHTADGSWSLAALGMKTSSSSRLPVRSATAWSLANSSVVENASRVRVHCLAGSGSPTAPGPWREPAELRSARVPLPERRRARIRSPGPRQFPAHARSVARGRALPRAAQPVAARGRGPLWLPPLRRCRAWRSGPRWPRRRRRHGRGAPGRSRHPPQGLTPASVSTSTLR
jgi:hypothetical protein